MKGRETEANMVQKKSIICVSKKANTNKQKKKTLIQPIFIEQLLYAGIVLAFVDRTLFTKLVIAILVLIV